MNKTLSFSSFNRSKRIRRLANDIYDLVIVGGGATGAGIALDAASRGLKIALIEKGDFASGTSSKSTKLIHGGLRYLKQLDINLVRESGKERAIVNHLAPHLCLPEKMLLPLVKDGTFGKLSTSFGLKIYDYLAGVKSEDKRIMLSKEEALEKEPLLNESILEGAGYYAEYRTDDARLTIELIKKSNSLGANCINYVRVAEFIENEEGRIMGVLAEDVLSREKFEVSARCVVSAGGPWVDQLRFINEDDATRKLYLTKGIHIVVPLSRLPIGQSVYFDNPDGRMIFAIPRGKITYIGTTDTEYTGDLNRVVATEADREYLLRAVNHMFPTVHLTQFDVISNWAGLRPLIHEQGKSPSELSRKDEIFEEENGLISIAGGKLTGYRKMAEKIVNKVVKRLPDIKDQLSDSQTENIRLTDDPFQDDDEVSHYIQKMEGICMKLQLPAYYGWYLVTNYGKKAQSIIKKSQGRHKDPQIALALSELEYCMKREMIQRAEDFFVRRTGRLYFDIQSIDLIRNQVMTMMSDRLNWSKARKAEEEAIMDKLIQDATHYYKDERIDPSEHKPISPS